MRRARVKRRARRAGSAVMPGRIAGGAVMHSGQWPLAGAPSPAGWPQISPASIRSEPGGRSTPRGAGATAAKNTARAKRKPASERIRPPP